MRRGSLYAAAAALSLGAAVSLTACAGSGPAGYAAVGAAGAGPERAAGDLAPPRGRTVLQPLPGASVSGGTASATTAPAAPTPPAPSMAPAAPGGHGAATGVDGASGSAGGGTGGAGGSGGAGSAGGSSGSTSTGGSASTGGSGGTGSAGGAGSAGGSTTGSATGGSGGSASTGGSASAGGSGSTGGSGGTTGGTTGGGTPTPRPGPARLTLGTPERSAADHRWCENVTVVFRNTGGSAVRSGTVGFATHIIGALGIDWATITSSQPLPAPIAARTHRQKTYPVCVEAWRVPLGMHIETREVTADWK